MQRSLPRHSDQHQLASHLVRVPNPDHGHEFRIPSAARTRRVLTKKWKDPWGQVFIQLTVSTVSDHVQLSQIINSCFMVFYQSILLVAGILIPLFGTQVKNKNHLYSRHLASYLVYGSEGVVQAQQEDWDFQNQLLKHEASSQDTNVFQELCKQICLSICRVHV